jgi:hypothetical protein
MRAARRTRRRTRNPRPPHLQDDRGVRVLGLWSDWVARVPRFLVELVVGIDQIGSAFRCG